jgi:hypothetical protein
MSRAIDTQSRIFREITCDQVILDDPARAPVEIARVLRSAPRILASSLYRAAARSRRHGG